ncbi:MAG: hypothetical protein H5T70_07460 [Chloroflexi bacterium]|nr:hypothetical protein [Chloroflexota bacterium]
MSRILFAGVLFIALCACTAPTEKAPIAPTPTQVAGVPRSPAPSPSPPGISPTPTAAQGPVWPPAARQVQAAFAQEFGLATEQVTIASVEPATWPNDCLGAALPGEACGNTPSPGYRVTLRVAKEDYVYHVDESGQLIRPAVPPGTVEETPLLIWTSEDPSGCAMALIGPSEVQFGPCSGLTLHRPLSSAEKQALQAWVTRYAPFESPTEAGFIQFAGQGTAQPSPEEALKMATWAKALAQVSAE